MSSPAHFIGSAASSFAMGAIGTGKSRFKILQDRFMTILEEAKIPDIDYNRCVYSMVRAALNSDVTHILDEEAPAWKAVIRKVPCADIPQLGTWILVAKKMDPEFLPTLRDQALAHAAAKSCCTGNDDLLSEITEIFEKIDEQSSPSP